MVPPFSTFPPSCGRTGDWKATRPSPIVFFLGWFSTISEFQAIFFCGHYPLKSLKLTLQKENLNPIKHTVMSFEIKSLYPSVNVNRVLSLILNWLYSNPTKYFPKEYYGLGNLLPIPTRANFLKLMNHTLTKYSIFDVEQEFIGNWKDYPWVHVYPA